MLRKGGLRMTPLEWFKSQGRGSQKKAAHKIGYSTTHLNLVIKKRKPPSRYFIECLNKYTNQQFSTGDFLAGCK